MKCLICDAEAPAKLKPGQWIETHCTAGCGTFRISANLVEKLFSTKAEFNVPRTRSWLQEARIKGPIPQISSYDFSVSLLAHSS